MKFFRSFSVALLTMILAGVCRPAAAETLAFSPKDRVLVVAPHPDDETIGAAGAIQAALSSRARVKVLYVTHGDHNELASLFYEMKPLLRRHDFIKSGQIRRKEALAATAILGLTEKDLIFLGYPDSGMLSIWRKHWGAVKPFRSILTRINRVPYKDDFSYGQSYTAENVERDFRKIFLAYRPTKVFVTAPFDLNPDHKASELFVRLALLDVRGRIEKPELYEYLVHAHEWPWPRRPDPSLPLTAPAGFAAPHAAQVTLPLGKRQADVKKEALMAYKSQVAYSRQFLLSFARTNELFFRPETIAAGPPPSDDGPAAKEGDVRYTVKDGELWMTVRLSDPIDEVGALGADLFAYRRGKPFAGMPKFHFRLFGKKLFVMRGSQIFRKPEIRYLVEKQRLIVRIPLPVLGGPDFCFAAVDTAKEELSLNFQTWKVLSLGRR